NPSPACRYKILSLTHDHSPDPDIGWEVIGYGSKQVYQESKREHTATRLPGMMSCALVTQ
ncbi:hypothetical protein ACGTRS_32260, partial [Burkholderia semiarida]